MLFLQIIQFFLIKLNSKSVIKTFRLNKKLFFNSLNISLNVKNCAEKRLSFSNFNVLVVSTELYLLWKKSLMNIMFVFIYESYFSAASITNIYSKALNVLINTIFS